jgi:hypothetical protein
VTADAAPLLLLSDEPHQIEAGVEAGDRGDRVWVSPDELARATGWTLKPEGLCRGDVCVPVRDRSPLSSGDGALDLVAVAATVGQPIVVDAEERVAALGRPVTDRTGLRAGIEAPAFRLPGIRGGTVDLDDFVGKKKLLLAWASW